MKTYDHYIKDIKEVGYVRSVLHGMVYASGLPKARVMELVVTETGQRGIVQSLQPESVEILMLDGSSVRHGTAIARTNEILTVPVGPALLGRSVDPFVNPIDGGPLLAGLPEVRQYEQPAPPIGRRDNITQPFYTGVTVVDLLVPLGKGQRELVIGDQKNGKTSFVLQTMINQARSGTVCIYVAIGKKKSDIKRTQTLFQDPELKKNAIVVAADASSPASFIYLAPFTGMTIAEYFRDLGRDILLIFDDLNVHAKLYREIALLSKKTPGREAYPGDIFYMHSHLIERAGRVFVTDPKNKDKQIGASITVLAVVETVNSDFTGYIQTNAMSMTDGHIFFDSQTFHKGQRPAVNVGLSVSRVGRQTRDMVTIALSEMITDALSSFRNAQTYARFGVELSEATRLSLVMGEKIEYIFQQAQNVIVPPFMQHVLPLLTLEGCWLFSEKQKIDADKAILVKAYLEGKFAAVEATMAKQTTLPAYREALRNAYASTFGAMIKEPLYTKEQGLQKMKELTQARVAAQPVAPIAMAQVPAPQVVPKQSLMGKFIHTNKKVKK